MVNEGKALSDWLDRNNLNANKLSIKLGIKRQTIYYHLKQELIAAEFKTRLSQAGYSIPELNVKPSTDDGKSNAAVYTIADKHIMWVPLVNKHAHAGYLRGYGDAEYIDTLPLLPFPADREYKGKYMAFEVKGDSMFDGSYDSLKEGNIVLGRELTSDHWKNKIHYKDWFFVIVTRNDGILIKEIIGHDVQKGIIKLHSLNNLYTDFEISLNEVSQMFNVVQVTRGK